MQTRIHKITNSGGAGTQGYKQGLIQDFFARGGGGGGGRQTAHWDLYCIFWSISCVLCFGILIMYLTHTRITLRLI